MSNKNKQEVNVLSEFMLEEEEREIRAKFGKYTVYEPNDEFREIIKSVLDKKQVDLGEDEEIDLTIDSLEIFVQLLASITDLPQEVFTVESLEKIIKKPKKIFSQIFDEMISMMYEVTGDAVDRVKSQEKVLKHIPEEKRKLIQKHLEEKAEKEIDPKQKEINELEKKLQELKNK